eukprot:1998815-Amphidinium_carterae.1
MAARLTQHARKCAELAGQSLASTPTTHAKEHYMEQSHSLPLKAGPFRTAADGEFYAVLQALKHSHGNVIIVTDCRELVQLSLQPTNRSVEACPRGHLWQEIVHTMHDRHVQYQLIKAHRAQPDPSVGDAYTHWLGNHIADMLAKAGANLCPPVLYGPEPATVALQHMRNFALWVATLETHMLETRTPDCEQFAENPQCSQRVSTASLRQCWRAPDWLRQLRNRALEHCENLQLLGARAPSTRRSSMEQYTDTTASSSTQGPPHT